MVLHNQVRDDLLAFIFRGVAMPAVGTNIVLSLHTGAPGTTRANEVSTSNWTNYARVTQVRNATNWETPSDSGGPGRRTRNAVEVTYGTAAVTGTPPVITHVEAWDNSATPRRLGGAALTQSRTVDNGVPVSFPAQSIVVRLDD
jgi:hypothetical protein